MTGTIVRGLPDDAYHQQPSLSASGAKILLQEGGPAKYRYWRDHPEPPKDEYEWGSAVHTLVLGDGAELRMIPEDTLAKNGATNTKAAQAFMDETRQAGCIPLKPKDYRAAHAAAHSVREHPLAAKLLAEGEPEVSLSWRDTEYNVELRCRPDWLRPNGDCLDLKTNVSASPSSFRKSIPDFGYDVACPFYLDGIAQCLDVQAGYAWIVVEKAPPYLVAVYDLAQDDDTPERPSSYMRGHEKYRRAVQLFAECTATGEWPGYPDTITTLTLPPWA